MISLRIFVLLFFIAFNCTELAMDRALTPFDGAICTVGYNNSSIRMPAHFNVPAVNKGPSRKQEKCEKKVEFSTPMSYAQYKDCLYDYLNKRADEEVKHRHNMMKYWSARINRYYIEHNNDNQPSFFNLLALWTGFTNVNSSIEDVENDLCAIEKMLEGSSYKLNAASIRALCNENSYFNRLIRILVATKVRQFGHKFRNLKTQEDANYFFTREYPSLSGCLREYIQISFENVYRFTYGIADKESVVCHVLERIDCQD